MLVIKNPVHFLSDKDSPRPPDGRLLCYVSMPEIGMITTAECLFPDDPYWFAKLARVCRSAASLLAFRDDLDNHNGERYERALRGQPYLQQVPLREPFTDLPFGIAPSHD